ncbi:acyltransferase family protein [Butyrivibrio proteoclasticus]|uniref:acyltransferase family protein n=1 Tax=Butyrivibrio proteoclasticus TaxID=43305 RepID=UPI00047EB00D|nr:acyltransferase [Butyrivibrio proteoclasticus]
MEQRLNNYKSIISIQVLRATAFLFIFASHSLVADDSFSRWGVAVFFILSGFLNALHDYDKDLKCDFKSSLLYAVKKIKKIYGLHLVMTLVALALWIVSNIDDYRANMTSSVIVTMLKLLTNILLISDLLPSSGTIGLVFSEYNIVTWYLSASLVFYILTPIIIELTKKIDKVFTASVLLWLSTIVIDLAFINVLGISRSFWYIYECPLFRISDYIIGIQMGYWIATHKSLGKTGDAFNGRIWHLILVLGTVSSMLLLYIACGLDENYRWLMNSGFYFTIPAVLTIIALTALDGKFSDEIYKSRILKCFVFIGNISAYAYLIHVPVINLIHGVYKRVGDVNVIIWGVISFVVTMAFSALVSKMMGSKKAVNG